MRPQGYLASQPPIFYTYAGKYAKLNFYGGCGSWVVGHGLWIMGGRGGNTAIPSVSTITMQKWQCILWEVRHRKHTTWPGYHASHIPNFTSMLIFDF